MHSPATFWGFAKHMTRRQTSYIK